MHKTTAFQAVQPNRKGNRQQAGASRQEEQKRKIQGMFGAYLSPSLVARMVESGEDPQLGGVDAEITAFFSDVQGFSSFSEVLTPQQLVALMNEYLTAMTDILMEQGCYVDKYIGDAIVGIFNAPVPLENHAHRACVASQLLRSRLFELRQKWDSEPGKWPPFVGRMRMRMGINTGPATVGNMGSSRRFNYTMMGDTVNLAARCESGAKSYGVYTMITGETRRAAEAVGDECVFRFLDKIIVKGRSEPAEMHEIVCLRSDIDRETLDCLDLYNEGLVHHFARRWDSAIANFEKSSLLERNRPALNPDAHTTPSAVLLARSIHYKSHPPADDWTGVHRMSSK
jgi:adenylate cyclase